MTHEKDVIFKNNTHMRVGIAVISGHIITLCVPSTKTFVVVVAF